METSGLSTVKFITIFVARHLSASLQTEKTKALVHEMARSSHREEYANIPDLPQYLSKDPIIIEAIYTKCSRAFL